MSKFPAPPGVAALRNIEPQTIALAANTPLARIYFAAGPHPSRWNQFRSFGPTAVILDCARDVDTCAAEVFRSTRRIDRTRNAPGLVVFALREAVRLLDLRGVFATTIGASTAIQSGPRALARAWGGELYHAYSDIQGFHYGSSIDGHAPAIALNDRAQRAIPEEPQLHRALNDDMLVEVLQRIAVRLSYGLR